MLERVAGIDRQAFEPRRLVRPVVENLGVGIGAGLQRLQTADALGPAERVEVVLGAQHRRRVDGLALEDAADQLAALGEAEDFRDRPGRRVALQACDGARREDQHAVRGFAAEHLLPGEGEDIDLVPGDLLRKHGRGRIDERKPFAICGNPVAVGHAHARGGAVPGEEHVAAEIDLGEVGQLAVVGLDGAQVFQLELLGGIRHPALAEAFPGQHVDAALTEHGPHGHLEGAGVGGGHDGAQVAGRKAEQRLGLVDGELEARLAFLGAVRAAEERVFEFLGGPAGALGAGAGGKMRECRPLGRFRGGGHLPTLPDSCLSVGRGVPPARLMAKLEGVKSPCVHRAHRQPTRDAQKSKKDRSAVPVRQAGLLRLTGAEASCPTPALSHVCEPDLAKLAKRACSGCRHLFHVQDAQEVLTMD